MQVLTTGQRRCTWERFLSVWRMHPDNSSLEAAGFTLLELVVVMVLIGLTVGFAIPRIRTSLFTSQLKTTARKLTGLIIATGQQARQQQQVFQVRFDPSSNTFYAHPEGTPLTVETRQRDKRLKVPISVSLVDITSVHGGKQADGELAIRFTARGYVDATLVHLRDEGGDELTLALSPFLGVIRIMAGYLDFGDGNLP